jgi:hypothetical protein
MAVVSKCAALDGSDEGDIYVHEPRISGCSQVELKAYQVWHPELVGKIQDACEVGVKNRH